MPSTSSSANTSSTDWTIDRIQQLCVRSWQLYLRILLLWLLSVRFVFARIHWFKLLVANGKRTGKLENRPAPAQDTRIHKEQVSRPTPPIGVEPPRQPEHGLPVVAPGEDTNGTGANVAPPEEPGLETLPAVPAQPTLRGGPKINAGVIPLPAPSSLPPPPMKPVAPKEQSTRLSLTPSTPDTGSRSTRDASVRKIEKDTTNLLVSKSPKAEAKVLVEEEVPILAISEPSPTPSAVPHQSWISRPIYNKAISAGSLYKEAPMLWTELVSHLHEQVSLQPPDGAKPAGTTTMLATLLMIRYEEEGNTTDLDSTITHRREAMTLSQLDDSQRSANLHGLAGALVARFERKSDIADLDEAITHHHKALELRKPRSRERPNTLHDLADAVIIRYQETSDEADLQEVIRSYREALSQPAHSNRGASLNNLAHALMARFKLTGKMEDIAAAIKCHEDALVMRQPGHPERSSSLQGLAMCILVERAHQPLKPQGGLSVGNCSPTEQIAIVKFLEEASTAPACPIDHRLNASNQWINAARLFNHPSTIDAYTTTLKLLNVALNHTGTVNHRHRRLSAEEIIPRSDWGRLVTDAVSCATESGQTELAVELLEQGQTIKQSDLRKYQKHEDTVSAFDSKLGERFKKLDGELNMLMETTGNIRGEDDSLAEELAALSSDFQHTVQDIRAMSPTPFAKLRQAAEGPVVIVNVGTYRSDVLIVLNEGSLRLVRLPDVTPCLVQDLAEAVADQKNSPETRASVVIALATMWDKIVEPVVTELKTILPPSCGSRIWWYATPAVTKLRLHAAGRYANGGPNLPDLYISSYTSTLGALIRSRRIPANSNSSPLPSMMFVGRPGVPGQARLPVAVNELLGNKEPATLRLEGINATRDAVLSGLAGHSWVHLNCQAYSLPEASHSYFLLHDTTLRIDDVAEKGLQHAELAVLSTCHSSATTDPEAVTETLHFAAAMQLVGFRSVVSSIGEAGDDGGDIVMDEFYKYMLNGKGKAADHTKAAAALNKAISLLRERNVSPSRWIHFVQYGA